MHILMVACALLDPSEQSDQPDELAQKDPQVAQDHADVVTASAQDREEGVAGRSLEGASGQAAVGLHVADHRLDRASSSQQFRDRPGDAAPGAADEDPDSLDAMAAVAPIDEGHVWALVGQDLHLLQRLVQGVTVERVARQRPHAHDEATFGGGGDADLRAELVALVRLTLGDAVHGWFMQAVKLLAVLRLLLQQPVHQCRHLLQS